jgi:hypothetical protein
MPMGQKITNDNVDEFLTSHIDGENKDPEIYKQVEGIIDSDDFIYKKYKSEILTKQFLQSRLSLVNVPASTSLKIRNSIEDLVIVASSNQAAYIMKSTVADTPYVPAVNFFDYLKRILISPIRLKRFPVPRYAIALVMIVILFGAGILINNSEAPMILNPYVANGTDKSVMVQAVNNFHKVLSGDLTPQLKSNNAAEVRDFFKGKVTFEVYVPIINEYELSGALLADYNGKKLAYILYNSTDGMDIIFIYETCMSNIKNKDLEIPEPVHTEMVSSKYYMCDQIDKNNCTMIMWVKDGVLCASVSNLPKHKMFSSFVNFK